MKESVIEETPFAIIDSKKNDTMHFVTPSFDTIKVWHCVQCGRKYDKHHSTKVRIMLYPGVYKVYFAKSGYCPECAKKHEHDVSPDMVALNFLPVSRDVYEHHSGELGNNKFGEVIETYRDGSHTACCL